MSENTFVQGSGKTTDEGIDSSYVTTTELSNEKKRALDVNLAKTDFYEFLALNRQILDQLRIITRQLECITEENIDGGDG